MSARRRRRQCAKCPWKKGTDPYEIPGGYCAKKHRALTSTIAQSTELVAGPLRLMACHETTARNEQACVGWLEHQRGVGNNIGLRIHMVRNPELANYELVGEQHETFEATLPVDLPVEV